MVYCAAVGCTNGSYNTKDVGFFRINRRRQPDIQKKWVAALNREGLNVTNNTVVCSQHFEADCFERDLKSELLGTKKIRLLKPDAIPTIFSLQNQKVNLLWDGTPGRRSSQKSKSKGQKTSTACTTTKVEPDNVEIKTEKGNASSEIGILTKRIKRQTVCTTTKVEPDNVEIKTEPIEVQADIQLYQAPKVKMVFILPPRLSLGPEASVNQENKRVSREDNVYSDRSPKGRSASVCDPQSATGTTNTDSVLGHGQPTHKMTALKKMTTSNLDREGESATINLSREEDNLANRMSQAVPGVVQVLLRIRPDVDLAILQTTLASILYAEVLEKDQYSLHLVDDHHLQLQKMHNTIKQEEDDPGYYQANTESTDFYSFLSGMDSEEVATPELRQTYRYSVPESVDRQRNATPDVGSVFSPGHSQGLRSTIDMPKQFDPSVGTPQSSQTVDIPLTQPKDISKTVRFDANTTTALTESALHRNISEGNPGSETETCSTVTASDIDYFDDDESPPLLEQCHSSSDAERCRKESLYTKERLPGSDSFKKEFTGLKTVPQEHVSRDVAISECTLVGGVETHHDCHFCDFTALDVDELFYHMREIHQVNMDTLLSPTLGYMSKSESLGSSAIVVENRPGDFIEKETDNDRDVYKCRECCYTFRRESAALSHVKMKHLNKEIVYDNLTRTDAHSAPKRGQARKRRDSDESFSLSEYSETSHEEEIGDEESDSDINKSDTVKDKEAELKPKTMCVNEEYVKTVEANGSMFFECKVCENRWPTMASLGKHISMTHSKKKSKIKRKPKGVFENAEYVQTVEEKGLVWFECTFCGDRWGTMRSVNKHISLMHNKKNKTVKSKTKFGNEEYAKRVEENGSEWFECTLCGDRWATMRSLSKHVSLTHSEKNKVPVKVFVCDLCGVSCGSLGSHKKTYHKTEHMTKDKRGNPIPYRRKRASAPIQCPKYGCGKILANKFGLSGHITSVHGPKLPCDICGKEFTERHLRSHMQEVHLALRKFDCTWPDCDKKFVNKWHLRIHMRIHTNEKPLQCELCGFRARQWNSLRYHVKKHHGDNGQGNEDNV